jgi:hypothetical protein
MVQVGDKLKRKLVEVSLTRSNKVKEQAEVNMRQGVCSRSTDWATPVYPNIISGHQQILLGCRVHIDAKQLTSQFAYLSEENCVIKQRQAVNACHVGLVNAKGIALIVTVCCAGPDLALAARCCCLGLVDAQATCKSHIHTCIHTHTSHTFLRRGSHVTHVLGRAVTAAITQWCRCLCLVNAEATCTAHIYTSMLPHRVLGLVPITPATSQCRLECTDGDNGCGRKHVLLYC